MPGTGLSRLTEALELETRIRRSAANRLPGALDGLPGALDGLPGALDGLPGAADAGTR